MHISLAQKHQSEDITRLIMKAMSDECCQYLAGANHSLNEFETMMNSLVKEENSQYSFKNTLIATTEHNDVIGICVSYDGKNLRHLRQAFVNAALKTFDKDYSNIADETQAGELYVDSLAVNERFRHQGIATALLKATIDKARSMNIDKVGLLVDFNNPKAEQLYTHIGFRYVDDSTWGGHKMRHLQYQL